MPVYPELNYPENSPLFLLPVFCILPAQILLVCSLTGNFA